MLPIERARQRVGIRGALRARATDQRLLPHVDHLEHDRRPASGRDHLLEQPRLQGVMVRVVVLLADQQQLRGHGLLAQLGLLHEAPLPHAEDAPDQRVVAIERALPRRLRLHLGLRPGVRGRARGLRPARARDQGRGRQRGEQEREAQHVRQPKSKFAIRDRITDSDFSFDC